MTPELSDPLAIARATLKPLARYHRHRVRDIDRVPTEGAVMVVTNHSLATYDGFLLGLAIHEATGRIPYGLGDNRIFQMPYLNKLAESLGLVPASPQAGAKLLRSGKLVFVAPGGMRESLRNRDKRYQVDWENRVGFARLAVRTQASVVLAPCPKADDIFSVYPSRLTRLLYSRLKIPFPIFRGVGPTPIPRPIQLTHYVDRPIAPPAYQEATLETATREYHERLVGRMAELMQRRD